MKFLLIYLSILYLFTSRISAQNSVIILDGNYQGKSLFVQNPFNSGGVGFCVTEIKVNGNITTDETNSSAFEIDLKAHKLSMGEKVEVKIFHKDGCKPRVLNPEILKARSSFEVVNMAIDKDGTLKWSTKNETGILTYIIEQYRWNKWVKVGELEGSGTFNINEYSFKITPHSGKNQLRIKQTDYTGQPRISKPVDFVSDVPESDFAPLKTSKEINFISRLDGKATETMYEVYDQYGNIVKKGFGSKVDVSNLPKGIYFTNFDNKMGEFTKK
jgi:hypothetical protein